MEVERLTAVLEASGLASFTANMQVADRATGGTKDQLRALTEISKVATEALKHVKVTAAQAMESKVSAESILQGVKGIGEEARQAARALDRVHLSEAQAMETRLVSEQQVRSLKEVEHQALKTRAATGGGGGPGMAGVGRGMLLPAAIGLGVLTTPAAGPGALGLLAAIPALASVGAGALGTLALGFQGVTKAIMGSKKAFDDLGPSAQSFVLTVRSLDGWFDKLKQTAGGAMFPGLTAGLKAALSPGTVSAITQAVTQFGHAIGAAGKMWGQYFGSSQFRSIFGPLMADGAKNFGRLSDAALRLFDAFGVLGRAAIPLVDWMVKGIDSASRWADAFVKSKDATGGLGRAMDQAKTSLQLVGNLFGALSKAVYELGAALYPVSKVAVKDLTDGLNALAGWLKRNQEAIRDLVGGALSVFKATLIGVADALRIVIGLIGGTATGMIAAVVFLAAKLGILKAAFKAMGAAALASGGEAGVGGLATKLRGLGALAAAGGPLALIVLGLGAITFAASKAAEQLQKMADKWGLNGGGQITTLAQFRSLQKSDPALAAALLKKAPDIVSQLSGGGTMNLGRVQSPGNASAGKAKLIALAQSALGTPYLWGGNGPGGFDCSGLVQWAFANGLNVNIPRTTYGQVATGRQTAAGTGGTVTSGKIGVGNVVFSNYGEGGKPGPGHEGLVVGFDNHGNPIIESAPHTGAKVRENTLSGFTGGGSFTVRDLLAKAGGGSGGAGSPFGAVPPWTKDLGPKPPKPVWQMPALYSAAMNKASANASRASNLGNTGGAAQRYLENELADLHTAEASLDKAIASDHGKHIARLTKAETAVENKIRDVQKKIADAIILTGDALLPDKLNAKLKKSLAQFTADSDYAQVLVGDTADKYRKTLQKDLLGQAAIYDVMLQKLKAELKGKSPKQQAAIQTKIDSVQSSLEGVQQQILSNLQANVQSLQSKVGTLFANVTQQFDDALGKLFFQNGMKTALEQQLADMQASDQLSSLTDSIQQAKDQLAQDQTGGLAGVQWDAATGLTKNLYSPGAQKQLDADKKALDAATRQLDEYNLGIRAAQERANMDKEYASQVTSLNAKLAKLSEAFQNGTGSMQALRDLASQYGIVISAQSIPDFQDLSSASKELKQAFIDLVNYIAVLTGVAPKIPAGGGGGGGGSAAAGSPAATLQDLHAQAVNGIISAAQYQYLISGHKMEIPGMASGGIVKARPGGTIVRLAEGGQDEQVGPVGGGGGGSTVINLTVNGSVLTEGDLVNTIYAGLLRKKGRNGKNLQL